MLQENNNNNINNQTNKQANTITSDNGLVKPTFCTLIFETIPFAPWLFVFFAAKSSDSFPESPPVRVPPPLPLRGEGAVRLRSFDSKRLGIIC